MQRSLLRSGSCFSPEQAADRLALEGRLQISHEAIYQHIYAGNRDRGDVCQHLRGQKPYRKRYVLAGHIRSKHADGVTTVVTRLLRPHKAPIPQKQQTLVQI